MRLAHNFRLVASLALLAGTAVAQVGGSYWQAQTTGIAGNTLHSVSAVDGNICWMAGDSGRIIRTVDGNTWSLIDPGIIGTQNIYTFEGVSDNVAFASITFLDTTYIYRTTNAGTSWEQVFSQSEGYIFAIKMFSTTRGIAVGDPVGALWTVLKTTDGGENWFRIPTEPPQVGGGNSGIRFVTFDTSWVYFFDNSVRQFSSNDGGNTWSYSSDSSSHVPLVRWNSIHHPRLALGITPYMVFRYYYSGWVHVGPPPGSFLPIELVGADGTTEFWLVQEAVYYTPDAASTWTVAAPNGLNKRVGLIDMVTLGSEVSAWATGTGDTVYHYHRTLTGVGDDPQPIPGDFSLSQNYPNPFNPSTMINYQIATSNWVTLRVYNILGQEVRTLVNERKDAGEHQVQFDAEGLPSGVYVYRILSVAQIATRKMLLLK